MNRKPADLIDHGRAVQVLAGLLVIVLSGCGSTPTPGPSNAGVPSAQIPVAKATSTPATIPDMVDVPTYKGNDARTGVQPGPGPVAKPVVAWSRQLGGAIAFTPVVGSGILVVGADDKTLYGLDGRTGVVNWRFASAAPFQGSAAVAGGTVFAGDGTALYAIGVEDGSRRWQVAAPAVNQPVVADGTVFVGTTDGRVLGFDASTGAPSWTWQAPAGVGRIGLTVIDGMAYASADDGRLYAIAVASRTERWHFQTISTSVSSPAIVGDTIYVGSLASGTDKTGELYALDRATGSVRWSNRTSTGQQLAPPSAAGGVVYAPSAGGTLYAFDGRTGSEVWHSDLPTTVLPLALVDGYIYAQGVDGQLLAYDEKNGHQAWSVTGAVGGPTSPVVTGGMIFQGDRAGEVRAYAEPSLVALLPTSAPGASGSGASPTSSPPDPFALLGTLAPATTKLANVGRLTIGPDGNLYALDGRPRVSVIAPNGKLIRSWGASGTGPGQFDLMFEGNILGGIAVSPDGTVNVADGNNHRVQMFGADGTFIRQLGSFGAADGQFLQPDRLVSDDSGALYVEDQGLSAVTKIGPNGAFVWRVGGPDDPDPDLQKLGASMSIDDEGRVYVANDETNRIVVLDASGAKLAVFDNAGPGPGQLRIPCAVAVDHHDDLFVWSCDDAHTQIFDSKFHLIADAAPLAVARGIRDMAFDKHGLMYAFSQGDASISRIKVTLP